MTDKEKTTEFEKKRVQKQQAYTNLLVESVNRLANTDDGQVFLNYLMKECGFSTSSIVIDEQTKEINSKSTIYNEARKTVYYNVRKLLKSENIKKVEYLQIKEEIDR